MSGQAMNGYKESEDLTRAGWYEEGDGSLAVLLKRSSQEAIRYETDEPSVAMAWIEKYVAEGKLPDEEPVPAGTSKLRMVDHRAYLNRCGVAVYARDHLEEDQDPPRDQLLLLSPSEALQFAEYVLAHRGVLEGQQLELEAQFKPVCIEVLRVASDLWRKERQGRMSTLFDVSMVLSQAYSRVTKDESNLAEKWWSATFTGTYSHELQEAQFWRYFDRHYRDQFMDECFPESDEEEMDEVEEDEES
jgi:hypothetical protein